MKLVWKKFNDLSPQELYEVLALREKVFILEQNCFYVDIDGLDQEALHLLAYDSGKLKAYLRILAGGQRYTEPCISRVVTDPEYRKFGFGKIIMQEAMIKIKNEYKSNIRISAQKYLEKFYTDFNFKTVSEPYLEDNIPHIEMLYIFQ